MKNYGRRLLDLARHLNSKNVQFNLDYESCIKLDKIVLNTAKDRLVAIYLKYSGEVVKSMLLGKVARIKNMLTIFEVILNEGFTFKRDTFDLSVCNSISGILSNFELGQDYKESRECIIKIIHYILSDFKDFERTFKNYESEKYISIYDIPYSFPILEMCYSLYKNGEYADRVRDVIESKDVLEENFMDLSKDIRTRGFDYGNDLEYFVDFTENREDSKKVKYFKQPSDEIATYVLRRQNNVEDMVNQKIKAVIFSVKGEAIGYMYEEIALERGAKIQNLSDIKFRDQKELIDIFGAISKTIYKIKTFSADYEKRSNNIDLDKIIKIEKDSNGFFHANLVSAEEMNNINHTSRKVVDKAFGLLFIAYYRKFLEEKYGVLENDSDYFVKDEVKCLPSIMTMTFIQFYTNYKKINWSDFANEFQDFYACRIDYFNNLYTYRNYSIEHKKFDFIFDFEIKDKVLGAGQTYNIDNNMVIHSFNGVVPISTIEQRFIRNKSLVERIIPEKEWKYVTLLGFSKLILSSTEVENGTFVALGYINEKIKVKRASLEWLSSLNNKEFIIFAGKYLSRVNYNRGFYQSYMPLSNIYVDDKFNVYIDLIEEEIVSENLQDHNSYMGYIMDSLRIFPSSPYVGYVNFNTSQKEILDLADSLTEYCAKHNHYYKKGEHCEVCDILTERVDTKSLADLPKVYDDELAIHYDYNDKYILKVYFKDLNLDMNIIESNVKRIVKERYNNSQAKILEQSMFIPEKEARDKATDKFIGYVYNKVDLNSNKECMCLESSELTNVPKLKSCVRLLKQISTLYNKNYAFIYKDIGSVYLSRNYPGQVQLINLELLVGKAKHNDKIKYLDKSVAIEYVKEILNMDKNISLKLINSIMEEKDIDEMINKLEEYASTLKNYCPIHKEYYEEDKIFCPKCVSNEIVESISVINVTSKKYTKWKQLNEGGESIIYEYGNNKVAKIFKEAETDYIQKNIILAKIFAKKKLFEEINARNLGFRFVMPQDILYDENNHRIVGYTMDKVEGDPIVTLRDKISVEEKSLSKDDVLDILIRAGHGIEALHNMNTFIGDLNGRNILFDNQKIVSFLDFDGMGIDEIAPMFYTDEYIDPVSKKNNEITKLDDWYSYAVQAFYYLTYTHPFNGIYFENGKRLEIVDKMEKRISLLGNHKIEMPKAAEKWDWMSEELVKAFHDTFEGDRRESIVSLLIKHKSGDTVENVESKVEEVVKEAKPNNLFDVEKQQYTLDTLVKIIGFDAYISKTSSGNTLLYFIGEMNNHISYSLDNIMDVRKVIVGENKIYAVVVFNNHLVAYNLRLPEPIFTASISNVEDVMLNGNSMLYYTAKEENCDVIYKCLLTIDSAVSEKLLVSENIKKMKVASDDKIMLIKNDGNSDWIYCNDEQYIDLKKTLDNYNILYDDVTRKWMVLSSDGKIVKINRDGSKLHLIDKDIALDNLYNIIFTKGKLYIPNKGDFHIYNAETSEQKHIEVPEILPTSQIKVLKNGFSIIVNDKEVYNYTMAKK